MHIMSIAAMILIHINWMGSVVACSIGHEHGGWTLKTLKYSLRFAKMSSLFVNNDARVSAYISFVSFMAGARCFKQDINELAFFIVKKQVHGGA